MSTIASGMGSSLGGRRFLSTSAARGGMGLGAMRPSGSGPGDMGVMPPSFGYPFRQPPSLLSTSSGMSMAMP
jgi:hypothetical protein